MSTKNGWQEFPLSAVAAAGQNVDDAAGAGQIGMGSCGWVSIFYFRHKFDMSEQVPRG